MADARVPHLQLVDARDDTRQFAELLNAMAGLPRRGSAPRPNALVVAAVTRLAGLMQQLEQRIAAIEAELVPLHRSRKCPCCYQQSLKVVAAQPHPAGRIARGGASTGAQQHEGVCLLCL